MFGEIIQDAELAKRNQSFIYSCNKLSYNAVLSVIFSGESTTEPVTLDEAKNWCRIDITDDDTLITALITAARIACELYANISFITRTVTAKINNGLGGINLPYSPVNSITTATDSQGNDITTGFSIDCANSEILTIVYAAGYNLLPSNLKTAVLNQIAFLLENRGDLKVVNGVSPLSQLLLNQVRNV